MCSAVCSFFSAACPRLRWSGGADVPQVRGEVSDAWRAPRAFNGCELRPGGDENPGANLTNFTMNVGIALSDQSEEGRGNLGVIRGLHKPIADRCAAQRAAGNDIGPDQPGWARLDPCAPNGVGVQYLPDDVELEAPDGCLHGPDGKPWPVPTLIKLNIGDAVMVHHATPHSASWNLWREPRIMAYFRLVRHGRPQPCASTYPEALADPWHEYPGLHAVLGDAELIEAKL